MLQAGQLDIADAPVGEGGTRFDRAMSGSGCTPGLLCAAAAHAYGPSRMLRGPAI